jgi:hypothetical protein
MLASSALSRLRELAEGHCRPVEQALPVDLLRDAQRLHADLAAVAGVL